MSKIEKGSIASLIIQAVACAIGGDDYMADFGFIVRCNLCAFGVCVLYRRTYDEADDFWMYCRSGVLDGCRCNRY